MHGFNTALLAKQLWNLHERPDSLVAKIMKAKYHKNSSVLEGELSYRPSFIWRSLLSAQSLLWEGLC
ncbi:hypothetical protein LINGRAHAP2_LOCUS22844 [Linum grandiflorum]